MFADYLRHGGPDPRVAGAIYNGVLAGMGVSFGTLFWWCISREHLKSALPPGTTWATVFRFGIGNIAYLAAVGIAFLSPATALLISGLVAVYYIFEQTSGRKIGPGSRLSAGLGADPGQQLGPGHDTGTGRDA
jgi:hypothetical protein